MAKKVPHILGIDRGSKYIGLAYMTQEDRIPMPIGYIMNDSMVYYTIADYLQRYYIIKIVIGRPTKQKDLQQKIHKFVTDLTLIIANDSIIIDRVEEDYSTVQAGEVVSNFKKNVATDTVSAMLILERYDAKNNASHTA